MKRKNFLSILLSIAIIASIINVPVYADDYEDKTMAAETEISEETTADTEEFVLDEEAVLNEEADENTPNPETYTIEPGQTYVFENSDIINHTVSGFSSDVDYIVYYADKSVREYETDKSPKTITVPTEGTLKVTARSRTISVVVDDDTCFVVNKEDTPVMSRATMSKGETYTFKNIGDIAYTLEGDTGGWAFDSILYDELGNIKGRSYERPFTTPLQPGYSVKMTAVGSGNYTIALLNDKFEAEQKVAPEQFKIKLQEGEEYTFENIIKVPEGKDTEGGVPEGEGTEGNEGEVPEDEDTEGEVPEGEDTEDKFPKHAVTIKKKCDYIIYAADGSVKETHNGKEDEFVENVIVSEGEKIVITAISDNTEVYAPYDSFKGEDIENTTSNYYTLYGDKTYAVTNETSIDKTISLNGAGTWDYILCDTSDIYFKRLPHHGQHNYTKKRSSVYIAQYEYMQPFT